VTVGLELNEHSKVRGAMVTLLLDAKAVAEVLGVSRATAYREMQKMVHIFVGERNLRVSVKALEAYLLKRTEVPPCRTVSTRRSQAGLGTQIFYDAAGQRLQACTWCKDRRAAVAALRRFEREAQSTSGLSKDAPAHSVAEALEYLIAHGCSDSPASTLLMHSKKGGHLLRLLGHLDINTLSVDHVQDYINQRLKEGAARETVRKELCTLRKKLMVAQSRGLLRRDGRSLLPQFKVKYIPRDRYLTEQELTLLLSALPAHRRLWVLIAVYTGARFSEVQALRWEQHIRLDAGWIQLPGSKTKKSYRKVPISDSLQDVLGQHWRPTGNVVEAWSNIRRDLAAACRRARIRQVTANDLRRTFASWLKQRGVDSMVVARLLGHTTSRMVELVYGHLNDNTLTNAVSTLPAAPESGNIRVTKPGHSVRRNTASETTDSENFQEVAMPRGGIEPPTRGFSVLCSTD